jgi:predicted transcriptional regulator
MAEEKKKNSMNIELPEEIADGVYANLAIISHSQSEFVVDFIRMVPNVPKAKVKSRVILTPQHAKRLLHALNDNIVKFEKQFGPIQDVKKEKMNFPMNFTPTAQA